MLLWDLSFGVKDRVEILRRLPFYAAAVLPLLLFLVIRQRILSGFPVPMPAVLENPLLDLNFWQARLVALKVIGMYLWMLVYPMDLSSDRSYNQIPLTGAGDPVTWLAVAVVAALLSGAVAMYRRDRLFVWCAGFFALALLPTSNLIIRIGSIMAERFLYLPAIGFAVALVALAFRWKPEGKTAAAILSVVALLYAGRTLARNPDWNDDLALTAADLKAAPNSIRLHSLYGENLYSRNPRANLDAAIREQEAAWQTLRPLPPGKIFVVTPTALGMLYGLKGDLAGGMSTAEGRSYYEQALATLTAAYEAAQLQQKEFDEQQHGNTGSPPPRIQYSPVYFYLGQAYIRLGRYSEGIRYYREGIAREPENPAGHDTLINALLERGEFDGAAVALHEKALVLGVPPQTIAAFRRIYDKLPDGACAIRRTGGVDLLDTSCPRVARDMCKALAELEPMFVEARKPAKAAGWRKAFEQRGCR
jgi:tetratricopeptide (TPR) repeat protein